MDIEEFQYTLLELKNIEKMIDLTAANLADYKSYGLNKYSIEEIRKLEGKLIKHFCHQISIKQNAVRDNIGRFEEYPSLVKWLNVVGVGPTVCNALANDNYTVERLMEISESDELQDFAHDMGGDKEDHRKLSSALRNLTNYLTMQNNGDDNFRAPTTVDLTKFHWDSWSKTTPDEDVFVITDPTESAFSKLSIQPGAKSGTLNSEGTSRHGSESSSNSHQSHQGGGGGRPRSETDQPPECPPTHRGGHHRPKTPSSSSGAPPPSPSYASSGESDSAFYHTASSATAAGNNGYTQQQQRGGGSSPPSQYSNSVVHSTTGGGKSPVVTPKKSNKLFPPSMKQSKSAEDNSGKNVSISEARSNSSQSINSTAVSGGKFATSGGGGHKPKPKKEKKPKNQAKESKEAPLHISWTNNIGTDNPSPFCITPGVNTGFHYPDVPAKQPQPPKTPKGEHRGLFQKVRKIFSRSKNPGDTSSISSESMSIAPMSSSQPRSRFPSTPAQSTGGKRPHVAACSSSTEFSRKDYSYQQRHTVSPATPRAHNEDSSAFHDYPNSNSVFGSFQPSVVDMMASSVPTTSSRLPSNGGALTDTDKTLTASESESASAATTATLRDKINSSPIAPLPSDEGGELTEREQIFHMPTEEWDVPFKELELVEEIGRGRVGAVYRGRWHGDVAIRVIDIKFNDEEKLRAFKQEMNIYKKTRHENIELYMASCINPPKLAIVTGFCKDSLYNLIRNKSSHWANKKSIIAQHIAQGMGYLHSKKIIHRDLKSKNVFYDGKNYVITDFGLMGLRAVCGDNAGIKMGTLEIPKGWLPYLAPEIIRALRYPVADDVIPSLPYTQQSDVYAFGTLWYEISTGFLPFEGKSAEYIIFQVGSGMKYNFSQVHGGKDVKDLLMWCWAPEPQKRPDFSLDGIQGALKKQLPHQLQRVMSSHLPHKGSCGGRRSDGIFKQELSERAPFKPLMEK